MTAELAIFAMILSHDMGCRRGLTMVKPEMSVEETIKVCKYVTDIFAKEARDLYAQELKKNKKGVSK